MAMLYESHENLQEEFNLITKENIRRLEIAVANLRIEVSELKQQLHEKEMLFEMLQPLVNDILLREVERMRSQLMEIKLESVYKHFFCSDFGFLYKLSDIITGWRNLMEHSNSSVDRFSRYYGKNIYPIANNLIILQEKSKQVCAPSDFSGLTYVELLKLKAEIAKSIEKSTAEGLSFFYTNLWNAISEPMRIICGQNYEEDVVEKIRNGQNEFKADLEHLIKLLSENGIEIIYTPTAETIKFFKESTNSETTPKPLIRRKSDGYVYAYGLLGEELSGMSNMSYSN